ncbi:uncharacterized protein LOC136075776 [Hydra vulgaris]|uniref:Uncharacterized protein LOC136075776 n=1 Tax=Hydra vulgaris TaxID=6087 RepID=A0ABM4B8U6_HYDVU
MPGRNCAFPTCTVSYTNKHSFMSSFRIPIRKCDSDWKNDIFKVLNKYRKFDKSLQEKIDACRVYICEHHFKPEDFELTRKKGENAKYHSGLSENLHRLGNQAKTGPKTKLNTENQLFMFLVWLKNGFTILHTSWLFKFSKSTTSRYLTTLTNFLYFSLGSVPICPSRKQVNKFMPESFKMTFPSTRCIIDWLLGISPSGAITFISQLYDGAISDKKIVVRSGFLKKELCNKNDSVMADRGFTISDHLNTINVKLNISSFLNGQQLSKEDATESQTIASLRIHVERAIRRIKVYRQISNEIPLVFHGSINQLWTVTCLLCNFLPPLIKNQK